MNTQLTITLAVLVFMAVSFMVRKISFGLTGMICMLALAVTGVIDLNTAFSGFSNKTTILVATMMLVAGCIGKTSLVSVIRKRMSSIQEKSGIFLLLAILGFTILLTQLIGMTALMSVMLMLVVTLDDDSDLAQSRIYFLIAAVNAAWFGRFPIGMGATLPMIHNSYYEGLVAEHPEFLLGVFDYMKVGLIPSIVLMEADSKDKDGRECDAAHQQRYKGIPADKTSGADCLGRIWSHHAGICIFYPAWKSGLSASDRRLHYPGADRCCFQSGSFLHTCR